MIQTLKFEVRVKFNPLSYFLIFIFLDSLLTYGSLTFQFKIWVFLLISFVLLFAFTATPPVSPLDKAPYLPEAFPKIPAWGWSIILISSVTIRCWNLGSSNLWPDGDMSLNAWEAVALYDHWHWVPFVNQSQIPSTLSYFCCLILKATHNPLWGAQIPPIVISLLTLWFGYLAARLFFSQSMAVVLLALMVFQYWLLSISVILLPGITLPLWEFSVFYFLGRFLKSPPNHKIPWACALGFALGLGPYTFFPWPVLLLFVGVLMSRIIQENLKNKIALSFGFLAFLSLAISPFLFSIHLGKFGGYLFDNSLARDFDWMKQFRIIVGYLSGLFFADLTGGNWRPWGGGFLNIILGSCFFVGTIELYRFRREPFFRVLGLAMFMFLLPGILSNGVEFHRILLVLPPILVISALGMHSLVLRLSPRNKIWILLTLLLFSSLVDVDRSGIINLRNNNEQRIYYDVLKKMSKDRGPGWIYADMVTNPMDYSLNYCSFFLNAALNPEIPGSPVHWAALYTENHYVPFLSRQFPQTRWLNLPIEKTGTSSRFSLGLFFLTPPSAEWFQTWKNYFLFNQKINFKIMDLPSRQNRQVVLEQLKEFYPTFTKDPYIQSLFFDKLVFTYTWERTFYPEDRSTNWNDFSGLFQQSFKNSYQDVVLCEKYGRVLVTEKKYIEAKRMFEKALGQNPQNEFLKYEIQQVIALGKGEKT